MTERKLFNFNEYAVHRGCHPSLVTRAVKLGKITPVIDAKGRRKIDPEIADQEWSQSHDPATSIGGQATRAKKLGLPPSEPDDITDDDEVDESIVDTVDEDEPPPYAKSRAVRELYQARIAKLNCKKLEGELVSSADVKSEAFKVGRMIRDGLLNIPARICDELAAEPDPRRVHDRITTEINAVLEVLSHG